jgi:cell division protein FtsB
MQALNRYPGANPFSSEERRTFFSRDEDIQKLFRMARLDSRLVLYAKSGLGKSSLLQAGLLPALQEKTDYQASTLRFGAYVAEQKRSPLGIAASLLSAGPAPSFLEKLVPGDSSLWRRLKEKALRPGKHTFFWIIDQAEELFTFPEADVEAFKRELAEAQQATLPSAYRDALEAQIDSLSAEEIELLTESFELKLLFAIRSDRLHLLDGLKDFFPDILSRTYELQPLTASQAAEAISGPAALEGPAFASPSFAYHPEAIEAMLGYLTSSGSRPIESFQLQILCQYVEEELVQQQGLREISRAAIGDIAKIYNNYYLNHIGRITPPEAQAAARRLIEEGLILEEEERRLSLYQGQIERDYGVSPALLEQLMGARLLRSEPSAEGGYTYELTHDSLVKPVLSAKRERMASEQFDAEVRAREAAAAEGRRRRRRRNLGVFAVVVSGLAAVAVYFAFSAYQLSLKAERNRQEALRNLDQLQQKQDSLSSLLRGLSDFSEGKSPEEILLQMTRDLEEQESRKIAASQQRSYTPLIGQLFSREEGERENARNQLLRNHRSDPELPGRLSAYAVKRIGEVEPANHAFWGFFQVMYILDELGFGVNRASDDVLNLLQQVESQPVLMGSSSMQKYVRSIRSQLE